MTAIQQGDASAPAAVQDLLEIVAVADPHEKPAQFVRDLAQLWKNRGGKFEGKARHSERYLRDVLENLGTPVRSLAPKLKGTTRLQPGDAEGLVHLFLSYWKYIGEPTDQPLVEGKNYQPMFDKHRIREISSYIRQTMTDMKAAAEDEDESISTDEPTAKNLLLPGQDAGHLTETEFQNADAMFTVSSGRTLIGTGSPRTSEGLVHFRNLMTSLWDIERSDKKGRVLVWILDYTIWGWELEDAGSRSRYHNVRALIERFKALTEFPDKHADVGERWNWLQTHAVIIMYGTRPRRAESSILDPQLAKLQQHHILFSALPDRWARSNEFHALYGHNSAPQEGTYSVFAHEPDDDRASTRITSAADHEIEFSYFAHAQISVGKDYNTTHHARSLVLRPPGWSYEVAYRFAYAAASHFVRPGHTRQDPKIGTAAVAGLQQLGFSFLTPDEFVKL